MPFYISRRCVQCEKKKKSPVAPIPLNNTVRSDGFDHWPESEETKGRYSGCTGFPKVKCSKCGVRLCFTLKFNYFRRFASFDL